MSLKPKKPVIYLITSGLTTAATTPASKDFSNILQLVESAVTAGVDLIQLREKNLRARVLYELAVRAGQIRKSSKTKLLVNDRADIARAASANGVHLTSRSLDTAVVRKAFGPDFIIGMSAHSLAEVNVARIEGASFAVFGPVFEMESKRQYGPPLGLDIFRVTAAAVAPFPLLALGGIALRNVGDCFRAGATGVAGIRLFQDPTQLGSVVASIHTVFKENDGQQERG